MKVTDNHAGKNREKAAAFRPEQPWLKYYRDRKKLLLSHNETLYEKFQRVARHQTDALAFIDYRTGQKTSYGELLKEANAFAAALKQKGIGKGSTIGVLGFLSSVDPVAFFGANMLGATLKYVDPDAGPSGMAKSVSKVDLLVIADPFAPMEPLLNPTGVFAVIYGGADGDIRQNCETYAAFLRRGEGIEVSAEPYAENRPSLIIHSSGSTGMAKPIVHSDATIISAVEKMLNTDFPIMEGYLIIKAIPSHIGLGAITTMITALLAGAGYIQLSGLPEPAAGLAEETVALLRDYSTWCEKNHVVGTKGLLIFAAPYFADYILRDIDQIKDLSFVKGILLGGAKMERSSLDRMEAAFRAKGLTVPIGNGYGQNELGGAVALNTVHYNKNGSAGYPVFETDVRIIHRETLEPLPYGEEGLIIERSGSLFLRYEDLPQKTASAMITLPDGSVWYDSTDLGYMDADGFLYITGRTTRVVIRTDHKVSLEAIEEKLRLLPSVKEAAVTAPYQGQEIVAFLVLTETGMTPEELMEQTTKGDFSVFERPTKIVIKNKLPRLNNGKIDYQSLEAKALSES